MTLIEIPPTLKHIYSQYLQPAPAQIRHRTKARRFRTGVETKMIIVISMRGL
jgi:hypothetical protein